MASGLTATYLFPYPLQTDAVDVAADMQALAQAIETTSLLKAPLLSPALTGSPTAPTPNNSDNSTLIATTAFVKNQGYASATSPTISNPTFTGNVGIGATAQAGFKLDVYDATSAQFRVMGNSITNMWVNRASTDATSSELYFLKARGTLAVPTVVSSGDDLGAIYFWGFDGAANRLSAAIKASVDGTPGSSDMPGRLLFYTTADGTASVVERLRIDNAGVSTFTGTVVLPAATTSIPSLRIPHGTAPSSPTNGDVWTTTVGMYARINGNTVGPFGTGATYTGSAPTAITGALWANSTYNSLRVYTGSRWASMDGVEVPAAKTASYTLALGDDGTLIQMAGATTNAITVPTNATVAFPIGSSIMIIQTSTVQTVISGAGVSFLATPGLKLRTQYSSATLIKVGTDTWAVMGDLAA